MGGSRRKRQRRRRVFKRVALAVLILLLITAAALFALKITKDKPETLQPDPAQATPTAQPQSTAELVSREPLMQTNEDGSIAIQTQYMTVNFPANHANDVMINLEQSDVYSRIDVMTNINGKDVELFTLMFSQVETSGFRMGTIRTETGTQAGVYLLMNEQNPQDWSADEYERICLLQDNANMLLMQLYESEQYTSAQ